MGILCLKIGSIVYLGEAKYKILATVSLEQVLVRNLSNGEKRVMETKDLTAIPPNAQSKKSILLEYVPEKYRKVALWRFDVIKPLLEPGRTKKRVILRAAEFGLSYVTLYRWIGKYEETKSITSLVPNYKERGRFKDRKDDEVVERKDKRRLDQAVEAIIEKIINDEYLNQQQKEPEDIYIEVKAKCKNAGIEPPSKSIVVNRLKALPAKLVARRRRGRKAGAKYQSAEGSFPDGKFPLDTIQIDHTPLDIILVDEVYRRPIGKAFVTLAIDVFSRMVFGFYITLDSPSFFSVGQTLTQAILPKSAFLKEMGLTMPWEIFGIPKTIHADNAGEFRSDDFKLFYDEYRIEMAWRPVARPEYGGHIERLAGTLNKAIHTLPGTTFSNIEKKGDYKPEKEACFTIGEIEKWFTSYVLETYHNTIHSSLGMTPRQKYEAGILGDENIPGIGLPDVVEDQQRLKLFLLPSFERTIQREGVSLDGIKYFHDTLRRWINSTDEKGIKRKFIFKRDPRNINKLYFYDPELKDHFTIPYRTLSHPSISAWELKAINRYLHEQRINRVDEHAIFQAYEKRKRIEQDSVEKSKKARREYEAAKHRKKGLEADKTASRAAGMKENTARTSPDKGFDDMFTNVVPFEGIEVVKSNKGE